MEGKELLEWEDGKLAAVKAVGTLERRPALECRGCNNGLIEAGGFNCHKGRPVKDKRIEAAEGQVRKKRGTLKGDR